MSRAVRGIALQPRAALRRLAAGLRKVAAGLRPFNESVWPGMGNDLFVAHRSIYSFAAGFAPGRDVVDAGCGTGYGSAILADAGARSVLAVDLDRLSVTYARRHFSRPNLELRRADCERLALAPSSLDLAVASNVVEHLRQPRRFLDAMRVALRPDGLALVALPPILTPEHMKAHQGIGFHRTNLAVGQWVALFRECGFSVSLIRHDHPRGGHLDFRSPGPATTEEGEFTFSPTNLDSVSRAVPITIVYRLAVATDAGATARPLPTPGTAIDS